MPVYRISSPGHASRTVEADDARTAIQIFTKTNDRSIEVTCEGPKLTTVWLASRYGQRVVDWRWSQEMKSALKSKSST